MGNFMELVNHWPLAQFVQTFGGLFEESPWVAERAGLLRPFDSFEQMMHEMRNIVLASDQETKLHLLRKHPDLGARISMSNNSVREQAGAGLDSLSPEQYDELYHLNQEYTRRFGFPFIVAVQGHTISSVLESMRQRHQRSMQKELETAVEEVFNIANIRLQQWLSHKER